MNSALHQEIKLLIFYFHQVLTDNGRIFYYYCNLAHIRASKHYYFFQFFHSLLFLKDI